MKKLVLAITFGIVLVAVPSVMARNLLRSEYNRAYDAVVQKDGKRAPGCNLFKSCHVNITKHRVEVSLGVLYRMLNPPVVHSVVATHSYTPLQHTYSSQSYTPTTQTAPSAPVASSSGGVVSCILQRESNNGATSSNIAQFQQSTWLANGGAQYAPTPGQASRSDQITMVNKVLASGGIQNWAPYDGC